MPLIPEVRPLLERRLALAAARPDGRLFVGPRGGQRVSTAILRDATHWDEVVASLGFDRLRRHDLRHTGLTWMADAGVPLHHLRKIAGSGQYSRHRLNTFRGERERHQPPSPSFPASSILIV